MQERFNDLMDYTRAHFDGQVTSIMETVFQI